MAADSVLDGVFAINKPYGMSSAQVIRDCKTYFNPSKTFQPMLESEKAARAKESNFQQKRRRRVKQAVEVKMGHGGTLDPMATGVLILGCGKGTKALSSFLGCTKTYETVVVFGASSDSYDRCGKLLKNRPYDHITKEKVLEAMEAFKGTYQQMPPLFSALKMDGKPLYEYAREGKPIPREIQTREVTVTDMEMGKGPPAVKVRMTATSGFYVRSFAHDLGERLGSAGLMTELVRSRQGDFVLGGPNCLEYDDLARGEDVWGPQVAGMLRRWNQPGGVNGGEKEALQKVEEKKEHVPKSSPSAPQGSPKREATPTRRSPSPKREGSPKRTTGEEPAVQAEAAL
ncbi:hypothetical protein VSDG_07857 [Cytospora chrysosperma]|uniref:tRNA pseudouridine(55) synthase n=1 Tax=Cytospora chrysosperma TaxID=252740 RepID=A0A423VJH9_CYTCH|nr:hypothetical protein VSDG_07857 [Valsa sordida]